MCLHFIGALKPRSLRARKLVPRQFACLLGARAEPGPPAAANPFASARRSLPNQGHRRAARSGTAGSSRGQLPWRAPGLQRGQRPGEPRAQTACEEVAWEASALAGGEAGAVSQGGQARPAGSFAAGQAAAHSNLFVSHREGCPLAPSLFQEPYFNFGALGRFFGSVLKCFAEPAPRRPRCSELILNCTRVRFSLGFQQRVRAKVSSSAMPRTSRSQISSWCSSSGSRLGTSLIPQQCSTPALAARGGGRDTDNKKIFDICRGKKSPKTLCDQHFFKAFCGNKDI